MDQQVLYKKYMYLWKAKLEMKFYFFESLK